CYLVFDWLGRHRYLPSFPTRRSSDLSTSPCLIDELPPAACVSRMFLPTRADMRRSSFSITGCCIFETSPGQTFNCPMRRAGQLKDRKSTRLNSSHSQISYAVFCLKKK